MPFDIDLKISTVTGKFSASWIEQTYYYMYMYRLINQWSIIIAIMVKNTTEEIPFTIQGMIWPKFRIKLKKDDDFYITIYNILHFW